MSETNGSHGHVIAIRGAILDVEFSAGELAALEFALKISPREGAPVMAEVQAHLDSRRVRALALQSTLELRRGDPVDNLGEPVAVPVGEAVLGRLVNALGEIADHGPALRPDTPRWPIHRSAPALATRAGATELFATGVKILDLLTPIARGGKAAMFGGAGVGKTVLVMELIHAMVETYKGIWRFCGRRRALAGRSRDAARYARFRRAGAHGAGLRPDERAARRALARAADRDHHRRVLPRRDAAAMCCC